MGHEVNHLPHHDNDAILINSYLVAPGKSFQPSQVSQARTTGIVSWWGQFIPSGLWQLRKRKGPPIIHRLDGVTQETRGFRTLADDLHPVLNRLADFTIFQTKYCQNSFARYGVHPSQVAIINNGVDSTLFFPSPTKPSTGKTLRLFSSSWSPNPLKGFATISKISKIDGVEIRFAGRWCPSIDPEQVILLGEKTSSEIGKLLRDSDAFLHAAQNEPCSNSILEALGCGLPVLYLDSGGNSEIASNYGMPLTNNLTLDIQNLRQNYNTLREHILSDRSRFLISSVAAKYVHVFEEIVASSSPSRRA